MKLSTRVRYRQLLTRGRRFKSGPLSFCCLPATSSEAKLGIIVPKKAYRLSVARNRIKRVIKQSWESLQDKHSGAMDVLVLVQPGINAGSFKQQQAQQWVSWGFEKAVSRCRF